MLVKSIFFDLDHTLWDFEKNSELSFKKIFKKYGIAINLINSLRLMFLSISVTGNLQKRRNYKGLSETQQTEGSF